MTQAAIQGFRRGDGTFGVRNHVVVMASVSCANSIVERIARGDGEAIPITHQHGCTHMGDDREQMLRTLAGTCGNPNVAGVLIVGLGCENVTAADIAERVPADGRIVRTLGIQEAGSMAAILAAAGAHLREIHAFVAAQRRQPCDVAGLVVGLECGGSDPFSGITANPAVGLVSDRLVEMGATVVLSEVPEMIGTEAVLAGRIPDPEIRRRLFARIADYVQAARDQGSDLRGANPSPGNIRAGLSTIEEKSLGCIIKGGRSDIVELVRYAQRPRRKGLVVMDTPGNDPESVTGMVAGGAQVVLFTTGVGTPLGSPVAPVIKIATNTRTYEHMRDFLDVNAGRIVEGAPMEAIADELLELLLAVCNGRQTAAEINRCREFAVNRIGATF
jgi:altronate dehydratase large subunit